MAPSRIADDYILSLSLTPPAMTEAQAIEILDVYVASLSEQVAAPETDASLNNMRTKIAAQLGAIFVHGTETVPDPLLNAPVHHPSQKAVLLRFIRNQWITLIRPHLMAQKCGVPNVAANDCLLLASFSMAATRPPVGPWEVALANIDKDESDRPFLMSPMLAASAVGSQAPAVSNPKRVGYFTAEGQFGEDIAVAIVQLAVAGVMAMPSAAAGTQQRRVFVRNSGTVAIELRAAAPAGRIEGQTRHPLAPGAAVLLISDGAGSWRLASVAG